jgi:hypothetical protein
VQRLGKLSKHSLKDNGEAAHISAEDLKHVAVDVNNGVPCKSLKHISLEISDATSPEKLDSMPPHDTLNLLILWPMLLRTRCMRQELLLLFMRCLQPWALCLKVLPPCPYHQLSLKGPWLRLISPGTLIKKASLWQGMIRQRILISFQVEMG